MNPYVYVGLDPDYKDVFKGIVRNKFQYAIASAVTKCTNIPFEDITSIRRDADISEARHIICYFLKMYTKMHYTEIGLFLGNRHHSTIINSVKTVKDLVTIDKKFKSKIDEINEIIINNIRA